MNGSLKGLWLKSIIAAAVLTTLTSGISGVMATAHAMGTSNQSCWRTRVELRGSDAPTITCLVQDQPTTATQLAQANTAQSTCAYTDLQLFEAAYYGGAEICFAGIGHVNLTDYWIAWPIMSWNDEMSSYKTGTNTGFFSWDINAGQPQYPYVDHMLCDWIGSYWNDEVSYVAISSTNGTRGQTSC